VDPAKARSAREADRRRRRHALAARQVAAAPRPRHELVQQAKPLNTDKVAGMCVFHHVSPVVSRKEVNYPPESCIPDLVDLDLVTVAGWPSTTPRIRRDRMQHRLALARANGATGITMRQFPSPVLFV
jgi:hypothetical protein